MAWFCPYDKYNLKEKTDIKANKFLNNPIFMALWLILPEAGSGKTLFEKNKFEICITDH